MYSFSSTVRYSECDENSTITIPSLVRYLQDCSMFHMQSLDRTVEYYRKHHCAWFIAAWQIEIACLPRYCDRIMTSTWCHTMKPTYALRSYAMERDGKTLVKAESINVVFDTDKGRATRIPANESVYVSDDPRIDLPPTARKLKVGGESQVQEPIHVTRHHLDTNHHVNNVQYIVMAHDIVRALDAGFSLRRLCVQYKVPAKLGDIIVPHMYMADGGYDVDLVGADGTSFAVVRMTR